ncbi:MAG: hypothetical protein N2578_04375 [Bdellovibrionaceae bacterium]|nr:hypothetical protein [Pseudobdellovibrionaceae bacterium]
MKKFLCLLVFPFLFSSCHPPDRAIVSDEERAKYTNLKGNPSRDREHDLGFNSLSLYGLSRTWEVVRLLGELDHFGLFVVDLPSAGQSQKEGPIEVRRALEKSTRLGSYQLEFHAQVVRLPSESGEGFLIRNSRKLSLRRNQAVKGIDRASVEGDLQITVRKEQGLVSVSWEGKEFVEISSPRRATVFPLTHEGSLSLERDSEAWVVRSYSSSLRSERHGRIFHLTSDELRFSGACLRPRGKLKSQGQRAFDYDLDGRSIVSADKKWKYDWIDCEVEPVDLFFLIR